MSEFDMDCTRMPATGELSKNLFTEVAGTWIR